MYSTHYTTHHTHQATMYSRTEAVIQCGYYADPPTTAEERGLVNRINDFWKPFYFRHVGTFNPDPHLRP